MQLAGAQVAGRQRSGKLRPQGEKDRLFLFFQKRIHENKQHILGKCYVARNPNLTNFPATVKLTFSEFFQCFPQSLCCIFCFLTLRCTEVDDISTGQLSPMMGSTSASPPPRLSLYTLQRLLILEQTAALEYDTVLSVQKVLLDSAE